MRAAVSVVLLAALLVPVGCGPRPQPGRSISVAAAGDLKFALDEAVQAFGEARPDLPVQVTYGASGSLFAQIENGAPFDLFLSADIDYPRQLRKRGLTVEGSEFTYAVGHLVLWVPRGSPLEIERGLDVLNDARSKKIALANPRFAPYGRAAVAALKSSKVYDQVKDRLVYGDNVTQAAQFAEKGAADVGLIALSLALAPAMRDQGRYWRIPTSAYPRLEQGGAVLAGAHNREGAEALRAFLVGEKGRAVLERFGFELPQP
jgi:molybdate transport system substrate-binding protein